MHELETIQVVTISIGRCASAFLRKTALPLPATRVPGVPCPAGSSYLSRTSTHRLPQSACQARVRPARSPPLRSKALDRASLLSQALSIEGPLRSGKWGAVIELCLQCLLLYHGRYFTYSWAAKYGSTMALKERALPGEACGVWHCRWRVERGGWGGGGAHQASVPF